MLEISINHTSTNVSVNFCQNSYIISLGGSRFFCYGQKKNLDLQKRKLYISIRTKSQSHRGSGPNVDSLGPDTCTRLSFGMGGWGGTFYRQRGPSNQPPPTVVPRRLVARPAHRLAQCGPLSPWAGGRVYNQSSPSPFPLPDSPSQTCLRPRAKQSCRSHLECSLPQ